MFVLDQLANNWQLILTGMIVSFLLCLSAVWLFPRLKLLDRPHLYGLLRKPIPYYGGIPIFLSFLSMVVIFVPLDLTVIGFLVGGFLMFLVGVLDDRFKLSPFVRILMQFLAGMVLVIFGIGILSIQFPFLGKIDFTVIDINGFYILSALFTIFWVMMITNAMNFVDGISGLNSGMTVVAALTIFALSVHPGLHENPASQQGVAMLALILAVVAFVFWIFDFPKPRILMGDGGSTFFGFTLATLAIFSGGKVATAFLVLGLPILDMIWVVLRRSFWEKKKFWHGDLKHLHHRLLQTGLGERAALCIYYLIATAFGVTAVSLVDSRQKLFILIALTVFMLFLAASLILLPKKR